MRLCACVLWNKCERALLCFVCLSSCVLCENDQKSLCFCVFFQLCLVVDTNTKPVFHENYDVRLLQSQETPLQVGIETFSVDFSYKNLDFGRKKFSFVFCIFSVFQVLYKSIFFWVFWWNTKHKTVLCFCVQVPF